MQSDLAPAEGARSSVSSELQSSPKKKERERSDIGIIFIFFAREQSGRRRLPLCAALLDVLFALSDLAPWENDDVLSVEGGDDVFPLGHDLQSVARSPFSTSSSSRWGYFNTHLES